MQDSIEADKRKFDKDIEDIEKILYEGDGAIERIDPDKPIKIDQKYIKPDKYLGTPIFKDGEYDILMKIGVSRDIIASQTATLDDARDNVEKLDNLIKSNDGDIESHKNERDKIYGIYVAAYNALATYRTGIIKYETMGSDVKDRMVKNITSKIIDSFDTYKNYDRPFDIKYNSNIFTYILKVSLLKEINNPSNIPLVKRIHKSVLDISTLVTDHTIKYEDDASNPRTHSEVSSIINMINSLTIFAINELKNDELYEIPNNSGKNILKKILVDNMYDLTHELKVKDILFNIDIKKCNSRKFKNKQLQRMSEENEAYYNCPKKSFTIFLDRIMYNLVHTNLMNFPEIYGLDKSKKMSDYITNFLADQSTISAKLFMNNFPSIIIFDLFIRELLNFVKITGEKVKPITIKMIKLGLTSISLPECMNKTINKSSESDELYPNNNIDEDINELRDIYNEFRKLSFDRFIK